VTAMTSERGGVRMPASIEVLTKSEQFDDLKQEWDSLLDDSEQCVFFLRWFWNRLWWDLFKPSRSSLYLISVRDDHGELIGLAPFYLRERRTLGIRHVRDLMLLGTGVYAQISEYVDVIARRGYEELVTRGVARALTERTDWDHLSLREVPARSEMLAGLAAELEGARIEPCNRSHHIDATVTWDEFTESLSRSTRKHLKRQTRRFIERYDCSFSRVRSAGELDEALEALIRLHQARWKSKGQAGSFVVAGFESMVRDAARTALGEGRLRMWTLDLNGEKAAVRLAFFDNGIVHAVQGGFDPRYSKESLGSVMLGMCIKDCIQDPEVRAYDFMGGTDAYKDWWTSLGRETVELTLLRQNTRVKIYRFLLHFQSIVKQISRRVTPLSLRKHIYETVVRWRHHLRTNPNP
jgi:CelD/BcsL family acetyltransferase involved in cellulose biosynthesis